MTMGSKSLNSVQIGVQKDARDAKGILIFLVMVQNERLDYLMVLEVLSDVIQSCNIKIPEVIGLWVFENLFHNGHTGIKNPLVVLIT